MHIKPDTEEEIYGTFLEVWKLKALIKKYSDYVRWPIKMDVEHRGELRDRRKRTTTAIPKYDYRMVTENETVNSMIPIWQRSKARSRMMTASHGTRRKTATVRIPCALVRINAEAR